MELWPNYFLSSRNYFRSVWETEGHDRSIVDSIAKPEKASKQAFASLLCNLKQKIMCVFFCSWKRVTTSIKFPSHILFENFRYQILKVTIFSGKAVTDLHDIIMVAPRSAMYL